MRGEPLRATAVAFAVVFAFKLRFFAAPVNLSLVADAWSAANCAAASPFAETGFDLRAAGFAGAFFLVAVF